MAGGRPAILRKETVRAPFYRCLFPAVRFGVRMNKRKYRTPKALEKAVEAYFRSISRTRTATEPYDTGRTDKYGHPIMGCRAVYNDEGEEITYREFIVAPRMTALCRHLGICAQTWARYASGEGAADEAEARRWREVCENAKAVCEDYLKGELITRHKGVTGIMFELKANYGYTDRQEIEIKHPSESPMTLDEREAVLRRLGISVGAGGDGQVR